MIFFFVFDHEYRRVWSIFPNSTLHDSSMATFTYDASFWSFYSFRVSRLYYMWTLFLPENHPKPLFFCGSGIMCICFFEILYLNTCLYSFNNNSKEYILNWKKKLHVPNLWSTKFERDPKKVVWKFKRKKIHGLVK